MGKGINMNAMDKLISGLSGNEENMSIEHEQANEESHTSEPPKQSQKSKGNRHQPVKQHICTIVNADSLNKIRAIANRKDLQSIQSLTLVWILSSRSTRNFTEQYR